MLFRSDRGLEDTRSYIVSRFAVEQVETVSEQHLLRIADRRLLGSVVVRTQFGHELRGILGCVDCEGLGNDQQRAGELSNSKLLS